jgi:hypothetical protein
VQYSVYVVTADDKIDSSYLLVTYHRLIYPRLSSSNKSKTDLRIIEIIIYDTVTCSQTDIPFIFLNTDLRKEIL